jgi:hypothetical protein
MRKIIGYTLFGLVVFGLSFGVMWGVFGISIISSLYAVGVLVATAALGGAAFLIDWLVTG